MSPLTGMDAAFLAMESARAPMHTLKVLFFSEPVPSWTAVQRQAPQWLNRLPASRLRLATVPGGMGQPSLVVDEAFDLAHHLHRVTLRPSPHVDVLNAYISRFAESPLDRRRPLWEATIVDGFAPGQWALVIKAHHALADGQASLGALRRAFTDDTALGLAELAKGDAGDAGRAWRLVVACVKLLTLLLGLPALLVRTLVGHWRRRRQRQRPVGRPGKVFTGERLSFNQGTEARRIFETVRFPFARVRALAKAARATVNDVLLAMVAGGLHHYLGRRGEAPHRALIASVPVGLADGDPNRWFGNRVSSVFARLAAHRPEPSAWLVAAADSMRAAKAERAVAPGDPEGWTAFLLPVFFVPLIRLVTWLRVAIWWRPPINLVVSNVPGPRQRLGYRSAAVTGIYSVGPLLGSVGLNITAWSYAGDMCLGLLACPDLNPDLADLASDLDAALDALERCHGLEQQARRDCGS